MGSDRVNGGPLTRSPATALERDYFMTAQEAQEFGIVDRIVERRAKDETEEADKDEGEKSE